MGVVGGNGSPTGPGWTSSCSKVAVHLLVMMDHARGISCLIVMDHD